MKMFSFLVVPAVVSLVLWGCSSADSSRGTFESAQAKADTSPATGQADPSVASKAARSDDPKCTCAELQAGKTGWCEKCGKGYFEGREVRCKGSCRMNPGGPPCESCVK